MPGFTKLYSTIITSSIWSEDAETCKVWITLLALAEPDGFVPAALPGIANAARLPVDVCQRILDKLQAPDPYSRSAQFDGRRLAKIERGWQILNYGYYRARQELSGEPRKIQS